MLGPFAPFAAEEMWKSSAARGPVFRQPWPKYDPALEKETRPRSSSRSTEKLRGRMSVPFGTDAATLEKLALADPKVQSFIEGKQLMKVIVVPDKLVNIV
ncbi:MAG: class I tRNA ligase family protein [Acidobacteriota bacterium]